MRGVLCPDFPALEVRLRRDSRALSLWAMRRRFFRRVRSAIAFPASGSHGGERPRLAHRTSSCPVRSPALDEREHGGQIREGYGRLLRAGDHTRRFGGCPTGPTSIHHASSAVLRPKQGSVLLSIAPAHLTHRCGRPFPRRFRLRRQRRCLECLVAFSATGGAPAHSPPLAIRGPRG